MWKKSLCILVFFLLVSVSVIYADTSKVEIAVADFNQMADYILTSEKQLPILQTKLENLQNNLKVSETLFANTSSQLIKVQKTNKFLIGCVGVSLTIGIGALIYSIVK